MAPYVEEFEESLAVSSKVPPSLVGADLLVWATGTGIALASLLRLGAWAVFC
jgi:hypothetical protein